MKKVCYYCDACHNEITNPHDVKMKEFTYKSLKGQIYRLVPGIVKRKIHLCETCFYSLNKLFSEK